MSDLHIFGIRHHGPGSARSVLNALRQLQADIALVEGPPDAEPILPLLAGDAMQPPIAILIYAEADTRFCASIDIDSGLSYCTRITSGWMNNG